MRLTFNPEFTMHLVQQNISFCCPGCSLHLLTSRSNLCPSACAFTVYSTCVTSGVAQGIKGIFQVGSCWCSSETFYVMSGCIVIDQGEVVWWYGVWRK